MIGSMIAGLVGQQGAQQGGMMAYNAAQQGATTNQNILNDQRKDNRVAFSPYTGTGRAALNEIGRLMGWGQLETQGGHDDWRWSTDPYGGSQAGKTVAPDASRINALAGVVPQPQFDELKTPWNFEADPGYQFRLSEGQKALDRTAAAKGKLLSGAQLKASQDFNQGLASQEYGNWWDRYTGSVQFNNAKRQQDYGNKYGAYTNVLNMLTGMAGQGQASAAGQAGVNSGLASNIGNAFVNAGISGGQAMGAGYARGSEHLASGISSGINNALTGAWMGFNPNSGFFTGGGGIPTPASRGYDVGSVGGQPSSYYRR